MKLEAIRQPIRNRQPSLIRRLETCDVTLDFVIDFLEAINHPYGLSVAIKLKYGDFSAAVNQEVNPLDFNDADDFADAYQSAKLMSKYPFLDTGIDKQAVALQSFYKAEVACRETNHRFRQLRAGSRLPGDSAVQAIISMAQRKIATILGEVNIEEISRQMGWGPGANIGVRGRHTSAYNKFSGPLDVTRNCLIIGLCCINSTPAWANAVAKTDAIPSIPVSVLPDALEVVTGNEIIFVPKNAKTDRVIAIEPSLNSYVQKGLGKVIRRRLRERAGISLDDQTINQRLAQIGSKTGELATIDLSMASDTISFELVRELVTEDWFRLLCSSRCAFGTIKLTGETVRFQKFSSMGNAYTFELESLIFYALAKSCEEQMRQGAPDNVLRTVSVYGDDLIVPTYCVTRLLEVLSYCGFTVNKSKSYDIGPFRESCGRDFFLGTDVRPLFLKERIDNVEALYRVANAVRRYSHQRGARHYCDGRLRPVWRRLVHTIPKPFRYFIPYGVGDVGIIGNLDESVPSRPRDGWEGYRFRAIYRVPYRTVYKDMSFGYTTHIFLANSGSTSQKSMVFEGDSRRVLYLIPEKEGLASDGQYSPRDRTFPKIGQLFVRSWYNLGPWLM